jgi:hypothetical protein
VVGRNCRFLQGPGTDPAVVQQLRDGLAASPPRPVTVTLLNYRKADASGHQEPFWNSLHIAPLRDAGAPRPAKLWLLPCCRLGGGLCVLRGCVSVRSLQQRLLAMYV